MGISYIHRTGMQEVIAGFTVLANLLLGMVVYRRNPKSATHILFGWLTLVVTLWAVTNYFSLQYTDLERALMLIRIVMAVAAMMFPTIFLLAVALPFSELKMDKRTLLLVVGMTLVVQAMSFTPLVFKGVTGVEGKVLPIPGWGMPIYAVHVLGWLGATIVVLVKKMSRASGRTRLQVKYMLAGIPLTFTLATITTFIFVVVFGITDLVVLGPTYSLILMGLTGYAIVKHRFLDISYLVARAVSYTLLLVVILAGYTGLLFAAAELLPAAVNRNYVFAVLTVGVAFSFNSIRLFLEKLTDGVLYKGRYDPEKLLGELTRVMAAEIEMGKLSQGLLSTLVPQMRLTRGAFVLVEDGRVKDVEVKEWADTEALRGKEVGNLADKEMLGVFEEMEEGQIKEWFRRAGVSVAVPLRVKTATIGLLALGPKASGEIYSDQDINLLTILAPEAAVALQNAQSYKAIQDFSRTLEGKVEERTRELEESQKRELELKDQFVFVATHDLRTPVTAIDGFLRLIAASREKFSADTKENLAAIVEASDRLKQLVEDLLEVARAEAGTIKLDLKPVPMDKVVERVAKEVAVAAGDRKVALKTDVAGGMAVMADEEKLAEVLENLLSNAVKFNRAGGKVTVSAVRLGEELAVEVADTGYGIPQSEQNKVFAKFFKARTEDTRTVPGTGLGLFVVRMLIEKMGGRVAFESKEGQGTKFTFTLPIAKL